MQQPAAQALPRAGTPPHSASNRVRGQGLMALPSPSRDNGGIRPRDAEPVLEENIPHEILPRRGARYRRGFRLACLDPEPAGALASEDRSDIHHALRRPAPRHDRHRLDRAHRQGAGTHPRRDPRAVEERLGSQAGHHSRQDGRQGAPHGRRRGHERQPGLRGRQAHRRGRPAPQHVLPGCHLRHHPHRAHAGSQGLRRRCPRRCAHAG